MFYQLLLTVDLIAIFYFFVVNSVYIFLNIKAFTTIRRQWFLSLITDYERTFHSEFYKPLSIIAPAYNEEETIVENVKSILSLNYPEFEVIVVNDGSKDETMERLKQNFNLTPSSRSFQGNLTTEPVQSVFDSLEYSHLVVVDKFNGGKADALNAGINTSH